MAINQLGRVNLVALDNYAIPGAYLDLIEQYQENAFKEIVKSNQSTGVIYGGAVSVVAGLTVKVAKGFALFSTGQIVTWDDQNVILTAANAVNPRYDRIEIALTLADNTADVNFVGDAVVVDKIHVATASAHAGVAAGSPAAPARTALSLSMAIVHVAALQVTILVGDIDQTEDSAFDLSYRVLGASPYGIRYNTRIGVLQLTADGTNWRNFGESPARVITFADSPYTVTAAQPKLEVNTAGGNVTINFPALASGFPIEVTKITADVNTVTNDANGAETINGALTDTLDQIYAGKRYVPTTVGWVIR